MAKKKELPKNKSTSISLTQDQIEFVSNHKKFNFAAFGSSVANREGLCQTN